MNNLLEIIKSVGIISASGVAIWGINSWRREAKWKRKYELAEDVLASFYEAHQVIQIIRSSIGSTNEGKSRPKNEKETIQESQIYDQAYVCRERFERNRKSFDKLQSLKFRFIAIYGKEHEKDFNQFSLSVNKIFFASDQIAWVKLGHYGEDKDFIRETMKESRETLYYRNNNEDKIENELQDAIKSIEKKCWKIIGRNK